MAQMKATVFGAGGFIGSRLAAHLRALGWEVQSLHRGDEGWRERDLGHVFYCVGLTADFRTRPFETIDAHVGLAVDVLRRGRFESLLYLSSTRVYAKSGSGEETTPLLVDPTDPSDLYNLSKLMGEAACFAVDNPNVRVARLSNVFGHGMGDANFLTSVLREAIRTGAVELRQALDSAKDYVALNDVLEALVCVSVAGRERLYNVASGRDVTHAQIVQAVQDLTGCSVSVAPASPTSRFPAIVIDRLVNLGVRPSGEVTGALASLIRDFRLPSKDSSC